MFLRQATASQSVLIGPFVDDTDGTTAETALTIANTDIRLSANGGNMAAKNSGGGTHDELGYYTITLDATDTATVGRLQLVCKMTGALVVQHTFHVLEEVVYDNLFAASAPGPLAANSNGSGLTEAGGTGDHLTAVPWNASWDAEVQSEVADGLAAYDPPTRAELTTDTNSILTRIGTPAGVDIAADIAALPTAAENRAEMDSNSTQLAAIVADTNELQTNQGNWLTATGFSTHSAADVWSVATRVLTANTNLNDPTAAQIRAEIDSNSTQLAAIKAVTDVIPDSGAMTSIATAAALATVDGNVDTIVAGVITGQAQTGTLSTTQATTNLSGYANDQLIGRVIIWTSGNCDGEATDITDYASVSGLLTFTALTTAPANGDTFKIV